MARSVKNRFRKYLTSKDGLQMLIRDRYAELVSNSDGLDTHLELWNAACLAYHLELSEEPEIVVVDNLYIMPEAALGCRIGTE